MIATKLHETRKAAEAAGDRFMATFIAAYPVGSRVRWMHNGHEQSGTVLWTQDSFNYNGTSPSLGVRNSRTAKDVRISLYDIEKAEGYDRFAR